MKYLKYLLIFIPLSILGHFLSWSSSIIFFMTCLSIVPLAGYLGEATEEIASHTGAKFGGFLNATFGNATELIIGIFALRAGMLDVVKASLAGSVLGNILLVLGCAIFAGGLKHKERSLTPSSATLPPPCCCLPSLALRCLRCLPIRCPRRISPASTKISVSLSELSCY